MMKGRSTRIACQDRHDRRLSASARVPPPLDWRVWASFASWTTPGSLASGTWIGYLRKTARNEAYEFMRSRVIPAFKGNTSLQQLALEYADSLDALDHEL